MMRDIMSGMKNVSIIDVWDMTVGHHSGFNIHPKPSVIAQELDSRFYALETVESSSELDFTIMSCSGETRNKSK